MSLIVAENIQKYYQVGEIRVTALKGVSFEIEPSSFVSFVGPSGSGKSSLAYGTIAQIGQHELFSMFADDVSEPVYKVKEYR